MRDFVAWVRALPVVDGPGPGIDVFLESLRTAADLEGSPPASPPGLIDFLLGSPPGGVAIPRDDSAEYIRALFRFWVEELRPLLRSAAGAECGCGAGGVGELDADADCITLAELEVPIAEDGISGAFVVADTPAVVVDDSTRPTLLHLRLLQELVLTAAAPQPLVAEGRVEADGTLSAGAGGFTAAGLGKTGVYLIDFPGFDASAERVVLGQTDSTYKAPKGPSTFEVIPSDDAALASDIGGPPGEGVVVRALQGDGNDRRRILGPHRAAGSDVVTTQSLDQPFVATTALRSVNFFNGRLLTGDDLSREQATQLARLARLGRADGRRDRVGLQGRRGSPRCRRRRTRSSR